MLCWPSRWNSLVPASLIAIVIATGAEMLFTWPIATIQDIPSTLVLDERLRIAAFHWDTIQHLIVPTLSITALGAIESLLCGSVGGRMTGKRLHANQELVAQGVGNIVIPFFGGVPATAAIARSSVGIRSGGVTRMVSIVHALALLLAMLCFGALISKVPLAALAGVLIVTAFRMNEWHTIRFYLSRRFAAAISQFAITLIATVSLDLTYAILIGFSISALMFLSQASQLTVTVSDVEVARLKKSHTSFDPDADFSGVKVAYLTGPLFFAATGHLHEALSGLQEPRHLILSMRGVPLIDSSGLEAISELSARMALHGGKVIFAGLNPPVSKMLTQGGVINGEHDPHVFWSAGEAIAGTSSL
jgi:SulP family sulfate permease